ncbi:chloride channel protein [Alicyclobacillus fastidiosus]|uniref:Chloride channel protein n=1 Tax=Alicyclobacillus fastidiosus TaxID=392011 RepID=A0ABY6ZK74_9BACL|nr:chloride channel protein [Alicyclobacillus fastidiosus]WAH42479.1 chloride channel protein [Alicyclobacillus fastidiosus]GMA64313.1 transport integral membrane protein [Alicyclobacillus fastidiosus]
MNYQSGNPAQKVDNSGEGTSNKWFKQRSGLHSRLKMVFPEPLVLLFYAVLIGVVAGYGAVGFRKLINLFSVIFFQYGTHGLSFLGRYNVILFPVIGLALVSTIVKYFAPEAKGHGIPEVMAAIAEKHSIIRPRVVIVKAVASAITIGSGGSVGREGPIVQIGSAFGSVFGQFLHLQERNLRVLVACGAGAGIAATFNAPVGGVMFATEVILGSLALQNFTAIVISCVVSAAIGRIYLGNHPAFPMPIYHTGDFKVYWLFVIAGVLAGLFSVLYIKVLYGIEDWFDHRTWPYWVKALFGALIIGVIGVWFPQIFGVGYGTVDLALTNHLSLSLLIVLLVLKLFATSVTIAAGGSGGVFSPGLYMGSMLGGAIGVTFAHLFPNMGISPGSVAAITMAGVFAGSAQAPVTSIMMLFEMTGDYGIILPIMITSVLSATIAGTLLQENIYTMKLARRGLNIRRKREPNRMKAISVGEALAEERLTMPANTTVVQAWDRFSQSGEWFAVVRNEQGIVVGSVARAQVLEALNSHYEGTVGNLLPENIFRIDEGASLAEALGDMRKHNVTYLLVTREDMPLGVIGSSDIIHAYRDVE